MSTIASDDNGASFRGGSKQAKGETSVRTQFVERSESWIKTLASELPESVLEAAMKNIDTAGQAVLSSSSKQAMGQIQAAIMIRAVRAIKQAVQGMSENALISAVSSASDFGALARALSCLLYTSPSPRD